MGVSYNEVEENRLISEKVLNYIPRYCECGTEVEFTDTLRQIYCPNPRCVYKVAARLENMAKSLKIDDWGESTCVTICKEFNIITPYQVFLLEDMMNNGATSSVSAFPKKVKAICDRSKRRVKLWEVVKLAGLQGIDTIAYKIFNGYDSIEEAFKDIEAGQVPFIANKLGIKSVEESITAFNVYNRLIEYKDELIFGETQFDVYKATGQTVYIAITGGVQGYRNKSDFIDYINNRYGGKVNAMLMNSVTSQVDILISDGDSTSRKYKNAIKINTNNLKALVAEGKVTRDTVGKFASDRDLHQIGEKICITDSKGAIERLDRVFM